MPSHKPCTQYTFHGQHKLYLLHPFSSHQTYMRRCTRSYIRFHVSIRAGYLQSNSSFLFLFRSSLDWIPQNGRLNIQIRILYSLNIYLRLPSGTISSPQITSHIDHRNDPAQERYANCCGIVKGGSQSSYIITPCIAHKWQRNSSKYGCGKSSCHYMW